MNVTVTVTVAAEESQSTICRVGCSAKCIIIESQADSVVVKSNTLGPVLAAIMHPGRLLNIVVHVSLTVTVTDMGHGHDHGVFILATSSKGLNSHPVTVTVPWNKTLKGPQFFFYLNEIC